LTIKIHEKSVIMYSPHHGHNAMHVVLSCFSFYVSGRLYPLYRPTDCSRITRIAFWGLGRAASS